MWKRVIAVLVVAFALYAVLVYSQRAAGPLRVSGYIEADDIRVGSRVGGRVERVNVVEGEAVIPGMTVVTLEPYNLRERRTEAEARLAEARAELDRLTAGYRPEEIAQAAARVDQLAAQLKKLRNTPRPEELTAAEKRVERALAQLVLAQENYRRVESLFSRNAASQDQFDRADSELKVARATLEVQEQELLLLRNEPRPEDIEDFEARLQEAREAHKLLTSGFRSEEVAKAEATVAAREAALRVIDRDLDELDVRAPTTAVVQAVDLQPGDLVGADVPVMSLLDTSHLWVRAYVPENRLDIRNGQQVWVTVDSFPGETFAGRVTFVSRQGEFTPRNVQTPEERSKQVFRIKVTLDEGLDRLRPGMAADVWFEEPRP